MIPNFSVFVSLTIAVCVCLFLHTHFPPHTENQYIKIVIAIISELNGYFVS